MQNNVVVYKNGVEFFIQFYSHEFPEMSKLGYKRGFSLPRGVVPESISSSDKNFFVLPQVVDFDSILESCLFNQELTIVTFDGKKEHERKYTFRSYDRETGILMAVRENALEGVNLSDKKKIVSITVKDKWVMEATGYPTYMANDEGVHLLRFRTSDSTANVRGNLLVNFRENGSSEGKLDLDMQLETGAWPSTFYLSRVHVAHGELESFVRPRFTERSAVMMREEAPAGGAAEPQAHAMMLRDSTIVFDLSDRRARIGVPGMTNVTLGSVPILAKFPVVFIVEPPGLYWSRTSTTMRGSDEAVVYAEFMNTGEQDVPVMDVDIYDVSDGKDSDCAVPADVSISRIGGIHIDRPMRRHSRTSFVLKQSQEAVYSSHYVLEETQFLVEGFDSEEAVGRSETWAVEVKRGDGIQADAVVVPSRPHFDALRRSFMAGFVGYVPNGGGSHQNMINDGLPFAIAPQFDKLKSINFKIVIEYLVVPDSGNYGNERREPLPGKHGYVVAGESQIKKKI